MTRRSLREQIFKLLFRIEFNDSTEMEEQKDLFFSTADDDFSEEDTAYVQGKYEKIMEKLSEIDASINEKAKGWSTDRIGKSGDWNQSSRPAPGGNVFIQTKTR